MASHDYYGSGAGAPQSQPHQPYYAYGQEPPAPAYPGRAPSVAASAAPSYASRPPKPTVSPFEAPFDDHVYPAQPQDSQHSFASAQYGQGGGGRPLDSTSEFRDDIPLRTNVAHDSNNSNMRDTDHVYDAADVGMASGINDGRNKPRSNGLMKWEKGRIPWVVYCLTIIQVAVFIAELAKATALTGIPIQTQPSFNPMIGPSSYILINMGARYVSCMHNVDTVQNSDVVIAWPCPNSTSSLITDPSNKCSLSELCGFGGVPNPVVNGLITQSPEPNQWFRFILPIFLHAGLIHIGFNMLLQCTLGREMEKSIGSIRFFLVYMCSGIFGFVMGANFAATGIASTGASGSLFGIIALTLLDLLYTWKKRASPWKDLAFIGLDVAISFVLGLLPGLDNFSHIGGFLMGIVLGICILHSPDSLRQRIEQDEPPYAPVSHAKPNGGSRKNAGVTGFVKAPVSFFKGRKGAWWAWWLVRAGALVAVFIVFILLLNNFYIYRKTCSWCKYLSCININNWCDIGNLNISTTKRSLLEDWDSVAKRHQ